MTWENRHALANAGPLKDGDYEVETGIAEYKWGDSGVPYIIVPFTVSTGEFAGSQSKLTYFPDNEKGKPFLYGAMKTLDPAILDELTEDAAINLFLSKLSNTSLKITQKSDGKYTNTYLRSGNNSHKKPIDANTEQARLPLKSHVDQELPF